MRDSVESQMKEDDTMAIAKPVNRPFTIRASKVREFENANNKKDIEKILKVASKFDKNINKQSREKN